MPDVHGKRNVCCIIGQERAGASITLPPHGNAGVSITVLQQRICCRHKAGTNVLGATAPVPVTATDAPVPVAV